MVIDKAIPRTPLDAGLKREADHHADHQLWQTAGAGCTGGKSTGPRTPEGLERSRKANFKHGLYSAELLEKRKFIRQLLRNSREILGQVEKNVESRVLSGF